VELTARVWRRYIYTAAATATIDVNRFMKVIKRLCRCLVVARANFSEQFWHWCFLAKSEASRESYFRSSCNSNANVIWDWSYVMPAKFNMSTVRIQCCQDISKERLPCAMRSWGLYDVQALLRVVQNLRLTASCMTISVSGSKSVFAAGRLQFSYSRLMRSGQNESTAPHKAPSASHSSYIYTTI